MFSSCLSWSWIINISLCTQYKYWYWHWHKTLALLKIHCLDYRKRDTVAWPWCTKLHYITAWCYQKCSVYSRLTSHSGVILSYSFTGLMHRVGAALVHPKLGKCKLWLCCWVDSGSRQQALPVWMTSCAGGLDCGICQPSTPLCSITPHHLPPTLSLWSTSTPSTPLMLYLFLSILLPFCPLPPTQPPQLGTESHNVSLHLLVNPPSPQASRVPSHLPHLPLP